jgi:hypothetical protein
VGGRSRRSKRTSNRGGTVSDPSRGAAPPPISPRSGRSRRRVPGPAEPRLRRGGWDEEDPLHRHMADVRQLQDQDRGVSRPG